MSYQKRTVGSFVVFMSFVSIVMKQPVTRYWPWILPVLIETVCLAIHFDLTDHHNYLSNVDAQSYQALATLLLSVPVLAVAYLNAKHVADRRDCLLGKEPQAQGWHSNLPLLSMVLANFPNLACTALVKLIGGSQPRSRVANSLCLTPLSLIFESVMLPIEFYMNKPSQLGTRVLASLLCCLMHHATPNYTILHKFWLLI